MAVPGLSPEGVVGLLFPVQPAGGVNVPRALIDAENGGGSFAGQDVPHLTVTFVQVRVELQTKNEEKEKINNSERKRKRSADPGTEEKRQEEDERMKELPLPWQLHVFHLLISIYLCLFPFLVQVKVRQ